MGKRFILSESEKSEIRRLYHLSEQEMMGAEMQPEKQPQEGKKLFCNAENTKSIHNLTGSEDFEDYIEGIKMRKGGVRGLVDMLEVLKTMRLFPQITDGGVDLASKIHGTLQEFKPYNYFSMSFTSSSPCSFSLYNSIILSIARLHCSLCSSK
jgi:hypothetical protein